MTKEDFISKLSSRKLWVAVAGFVSGLILALGGNENTAVTVSGVILQGASVLGYLLAEGLTDAAGAGVETVIVLPQLPEVQPGAETPATEDSGGRGVRTVVTAPADVIRNTVKETVERAEDAEDSCDG